MREQISLTLCQAVCQLQCGWSVKVHCVGSPSNVRYGSGGCSHFITSVNHRKEAGCRRVLLSWGFVVKVADAMIGNLVDRRQPLPVDSL